VHTKEKDNMSVEKFQSQDVDTARSDESVQSAARKLKARNVGSLVVVNELRQPLGMITDRDLATRVIAEGRDPVLTKVRDVMTTDPVTIDMNASLKVVRVMRLGRCQRIPVLNSSTGQLQGILSLDNVLALFADQLHGVDKSDRDESLPR